MKGGSGVKSRTGLFFRLSILVLLLALAACSDDDSTEPQVTEDPPPPSPELLVEDFIDVLEGEDLAGLDWLLNEDFRMIISAETIDDWAGGGHPLLLDYFDHDDFPGDPCEYLQRFHGT